MCYLESEATKMCNEIAFYVRKWSQLVNIEENSRIDLPLTDKKTKNKCQYEQTTNANGAYL